jgi:hypothetical protein
MATRARAHLITSSVASRAGQPRLRRPRSSKMLRHFLVARPCIRGRRAPRCSVGGYEMHSSARPGSAFGWARAAAFLWVVMQGLAACQAGQDEPHGDAAADAFESMACVASPFPVDGEPCSPLPEGQVCRDGPCDGDCVATCQCVGGEWTCFEECRDYQDAGATTCSGLALLCPTVCEGV